MHRSLLLTGVLLAGLLPAAGCSKPLNIDVSKDLALGDVFEQPIDGLSKERKIQVTMTPTGGPAEMFVYLEKDKEQAEKSIYAKTEDKLLASARKIEDGKETKLEATIPPQSPAIVQVNGVGKKITMKLNIRSQ